MTALASRATSTPQPVAGPRFRAATKLLINGNKRRRLLALIAAYADAGQTSPPMRELVARLTLPPRAIDGLLDKLEADGLIEVTWAGHHSAPGHRGSVEQHRNTYQLGSWAP